MPQPGLVVDTSRTCGPQRPGPMPWRRPWTGFTVSWTELVAVLEAVPESAASYPLRTVKRRAERTGHVAWLAKASLHRHDDGGLLLLVVVLD